MFRAPDPWSEQEDEEPLTCGFPAGLHDKYDLDEKVIGKGGFGAVRVARSRATGIEWACKAIAKRLSIPNVSAAKQQQHLENIKREILVMRKLRGTLNVVSLEDVFEDDENVYIIMELCRGGELLERVSTSHYSERTVASYMRAVLRTIAQCHHHKILHRDIKPGNFMLLTEAEDSPIKALDFGLAVFFDPKDLPLKNLGLEGTPHFMAPEMLSSEVYPASDVWAAGVMAYQLLSGRMPFEDWRNPRSPALSQLWKSILTDEPSFSGAAWSEVTEGAKDFIRTLLNKDPRQRPSAARALEHPWIQGKKTQRVEGKPLASTIVQRLQRYSTESAFKRTVLDMIANELLSQHMTSVLAQKARAPSTTTATALGGQSPSTPSAANLPGGVAGVGMAGASPGSDQPGQVTPLGLQHLQQSRSTLPLPATSSSPQLSFGGASSTQASPGAGLGQDLALAAAQAESLHRVLQEGSLRAGRLGLLTSRLQHPHTGASGGPGHGSHGTAGSPFMAGSAEGQSDAEAAAAAAALAPSDPTLRSLAAQSLLLDSGLKSATVHASTQAYNLLSGLGAQQRNRRETNPGRDDSPMKPQPPVTPGPTQPAAPPAHPTLPSHQPKTPQQLSGPVQLPSMSRPVPTPAAGGLDPNARGRKSTDWSGHALQHYAFLLATGAGSVQCARSRAGGSLHGGPQNSLPWPMGGVAPLSGSGGSGNVGGAHGGTAGGGSMPGGTSALTRAHSMGGGNTSRLSKETPRMAIPEDSPADDYGMGDEHHAHMMMHYVGSPPGLSLKRSADYASSGATAFHPGTSPFHHQHAGLRLLGAHSGSGTAVGGSAHIGGSAHGGSNDDLLRLLDSVQRQRNEHRKLQRLSLDTSGHGGTKYWAAVGQQGHALETVEEVVAAAPASDASLHAAPPQSMNTSPSASPSPASPAQQQQQQEGNKPGAGAGGKGSPGSPRSPSKLQSQGGLLSKVGTVLKKPVEMLLGAVVHPPSHAPQPTTPPMSPLPSPPRPGMVPIKRSSLHAHMVPDHELAAAATSLLDEAERAVSISAAAAPALPPLPGEPPAGSQQRVGASPPGPLLQTVEAMPAAGSEQAGGESGAGESGRRTRDLEEGGRGRGAYKALLAESVTGHSQQPVVPTQEGAQAALAGATGAGGAGAATSNGAAGTPAAGTPLPAVGLLSVHTVKAHHKRPSAESMEAAAAAAVARQAAEESSSIQSQLARLQQQPETNNSAVPGGGLQAVPTPGGASAPVDMPRPGNRPPAGSLKEQTTAVPAVGSYGGAGVGVLRGTSTSGGAGTSRLEGTVSRGMVYNVLGKLMGGASQLAEFQAVLSKLQYDTHQELSYEQVSEGLKHMGYHLEPGEVEVLLREVALGADTISQSSFLASQVDWRAFQANHREEWLACMRKAFAELDTDASGRISTDDIVAVLKSKLPEDEVNLAVQETLMDAAMLGPDGLDFDDFVRLLAEDPSHVSDLSSVDSGSHHGGLAPQMSGGAQGFHPTSTFGAGGGGGRNAGGSLAAGKRSTSIDLFDSRLQADASAHGSPGGLQPLGAPKHRFFVGTPDTHHHNLAASPPARPGPALGMGAGPGVSAARAVQPPAPAPPPASAELFPLYARHVVQGAGSTQGAPAGQAPTAGGGQPQQVQQRDAAQTAASGSAQQPLSEDSQPAEAARQPALQSSQQQQKEQKPRLQFYVGPPLPEDSQPEPGQAQQSSRQQQQSSQPVPQKQKPRLQFYVGPPMPGIGSPAQSGSFMPVKEEDS